MLTKENFNESHKLRGMEVEGVDTCMLKEYLEKKLRLQRTDFP